MTVSRKMAIILNWILTAIYLVFAFWADWRIGTAFFAYDLSCAFSDAITEWQINRALKNILTEVEQKRMSKGV
jgi:hypothetical protein